MVVWVSVLSVLAYHNSYAILGKLIDLAIWLKTVSGDSLPRKELDSRKEDCVSAVERALVIALCVLLIMSLFNQESTWRAKHVLMR